MNFKTLLIAVMALVTMTTMAQTETAAKTAYAVYCAGSDAESDPATLYFLAAETAPTGTYNGQSIAKDSEEKECVWSGPDVTAANYKTQNWNSNNANIKRVVFDESFKDVKPTSCYRWFYGCSNLATIIGLEYLNTENVTDMSSMFDGCKALAALNLSSFKTASVTNMSSMFNGCSALESLTFGDGFTAANVKFMNYMFCDCKALKTLDLSSFKTENVTSMNSMFRDCSALESLTLGSNFTTKVVISMNFMFSGCSALTALDLSKFNTEKVTDMNFMFRDCSALTALDLSNFNTENVTNMSSMFSECSALTALNLSNFTTDALDNEYSYYSMFYGCNNLLSLNLSRAGKGGLMLATNSKFAKRGMVIYLPGMAEVSEDIVEENYLVKPDRSTGIVYTSFARKFTSDNMSTLCLPFAVNTADVTAGTFYEFKGNDGNTVKFTKLASGKTVANKAYLFKPSTGDKVTFTGTAITGLPEMTEGEADGLYGVFTKKVFTQDEADRNIYYGWSAGNFVSIDKGATLNAGRAYLKLSQTSGAKNILKAVFDDETTGISEVNATDNNAPTYDLMGHRVTAGYKGIVIKNGRKITSKPLPASPKGR